MTSHSPSNEEIATLGGGCFWCLEPIYDNLRGVTDVVSGYAGGQVPNPTYRQICTGTTGHAEVVRVKFNPEEISYHDILQFFFAFHDPTTLNRQGADVGTQYRSVIFYHSPEQKETAQALIRELDQEGIWTNPIVTELSPAPTFYPAEEYHQDYYEQNPNQPYCRAVIAPKMAKLRQKYQDRLK